MPAKPVTITLPAAVARKLKARVASGEYRSESDVVREGLRVLDEREAELEHWLKTEGVRRNEAYLAGKEKSAPAAEAFARIKAKIGKRGRL